jgi:hypothetical protein
MGTNFLFYVICILYTDVIKKREYCTNLIEEGKADLPVDLCDNVSVKMEEQWRTSNVMKTNLCQFCVHYSMCRKV